MQKIFYQKHSHSVFQWFLSIFAVIILIFYIAMIPLLIYLKNTYFDLQQEQLKQQLQRGSLQIESVVTGTLNASEILSNDSRLFSLRYDSPDKISVPVNTLRQAKSTFQGLMLPLDLISFAALQIDLEQNIVLTNESIYYKEGSLYYPDAFYVDDYTQTEWIQLLSGHTSGFLPVHRIKTPAKEFDALIYSTSWYNDTYLYTCINISDIKKLILTDSNQAGFYFTISTQGGDILYSDLPIDQENYQTLSNRISKGRLEISVHVDNTVLSQKMYPLYFFMGIYGTISIIIIVFVLFAGTKIITKPIQNIIYLLENSQNISSPNRSKTMVQQKGFQKRYNGFDYISDSILTADTHLKEYQNMIDTQKKILQARYLEKALSGQLTSPKDVQQFYSYFPAFPESYCLLLIRLWTYEEDSPTLYTEPLQLVASFLKSELPNAYQQQFSDSELLLLVSEGDYETYRQSLDFVIRNINQEEPSYFIRCVSSRFCHHLETMPVAYHQLQEMSELSFEDEQRRVCSSSDCPKASTAPLAMADLLTLYTAITYGNRDTALNKFRTYSEELKHTPTSSSSRHTFEMIRTILTCIKLEHPSQLIDLHIPAYSADENQYAQLEELIRTFCDIINESQQANVEPFAKELLQYIDANYMDCDLCLTTLETHFKCSSSTIRKTFKNATDMTITRYIEQKRMTQANELLAQKQNTIAEIALKCGFSSTNSFYKAYRRVYGHAPTMQE